MTGITFLAGFEWVKTVNQLRGRQRGIRCKCSRTQLVHLSSRPPVRSDPISFSLARAPSLSLPLSLLSSPSRDAFFRSVFLRLITPTTCTIALLRAAAAAAAVWSILSKFCVPSGLHLESFSSWCK
jgi:hypothetical protein